MQLFPYSQNGGHDHEILTRVLLLYMVVVNIYVVVYLFEENMWTLIVG